MANENTTNQGGTQNHEEPKHHESWIRHVVNEIKEEIAELTEEAQNMDGDDFSAIGNGHLNVVHNHRHDDDQPEGKKQD